MFKQSILITIFHSGTCIWWSNVCPGRLSCTLRLKVSYCDAIKFFFVCVCACFVVFVVVIVIVIIVRMHFRTHNLIVLQ